MGNLSKQKRDILLNHLESIKELCLNNNESLIAINEIELQLTDKKYGLIWEEHEEQVDVEMQTKIPVFIEDKEREIISDSSLPFNFIIEGDNLHSLKLLEKTHKGSVDVIYIDPPYNTGSKDWKYDNDYVDKENSYRHSKWLSMMNNRLTVAKNLLTSEGVLICAIDENEQATLKLLLEDIFGQSYTIDCITIVHNPRGVQGKNFSYVHEYAFFVYKRNLQVIGYTDVEPEEIDWSNFRNWGSESERTDAKNCFYSVDVKDGEIIGCGEVLDDEVHPTQTEIDKDGVHHIYPIDVEGVERKWRYARQTVDDISKYLRAKDTTGRYEIEIGKDFAPFKTVWTNKKYDANEYGTQLIGSMVPENDFDFPKSLYNVYDCIYAVIKDKPDAIVLDFFAGSGTTGHAVMKMNENLGGNRKFILCTNNAIGIKKEKEFSKQFGEIESNLKVWEEWQDKYGIARSITFKRIESAIKGYVHNKNQKTTLFEKEIKIGDLKKVSKLLC